MVEKPECGSTHAAVKPGMAIAMSDVDAWFGREILPLEAALMEFLQHNWRNRSDLTDFRQDIYVRVYQAAQKQIPDHPRQFLFTTARNLLIDKFRSRQVVPLETVGDPETLSLAAEQPSPESSAIARDELRRLQVALDRLPPRCRQAVLLQKLEGLSRREIALRMGVGEETVKDYLATGLFALSDLFFGDDTQRPA